MRHRIFRSTMIMAMIVLLCSIALILGSLYVHYGTAQVHQLRDQLSLAAAATEQSGIHFLEHVGSSRYRLTWICNDGSVIYDTQFPVEQLENHLSREEFIEALETGRGSSIRTSDTVMERTVYEAVVLKDGSLLRISVKRDSPLSLMLGLLPVVMIVVVVIFFLSLHLSRRISTKILAPINCIDPEDPLASASEPEIAPLLQRLHSQNHQIHTQLRELEDRAEEFRRITDSMQEGLVLTDQNGAIRSMNPAARQIFSHKEVLPPDLHAIDLTGEIWDAFTTALDQEQAVVRILREGRYYRLDLSPISTGNSTQGVVILAIDITESVNAQINRRNFSANVSHELKTPIQTILGSAELLENRMVKNEDLPRFYGHIRKEATRLLDLVRDILRLSQMEEGAAMTEEPVDLKILCSECLADLRSKAASKNITVVEETEEAILSGVPRMLRELIGNLCHNAIVYNVEGGSLLVKLQNTPHTIILTVKDTGIGISQEHHEKIFERFYRVDKSHSRASGGTGLGLSIVKHAAEYHNALIHLSSTPNIGTEIRITFPKGVL